MGGGICSCCESHPGKSLELNITSPKNKLSLLGFTNLLSPKSTISDFDLAVRIKQISTVTSSKSLKLKVLNSGGLAKGSLFTITPQGLSTSSRLSKDGYTYFGSYLSNDSGILNDIAIPIQDSEPPLSASRNFMISYSIEKDSYLLKDLGKGYGPFVKLVHSTVIENKAIKNNWMINIGETFIVFQIEVFHMSPPRLTVKKFSGNENGNIRSFEAADFFDGFLRIGRKKECEIWIEDFLISKVQCSVFYDVNNGWSLIDGDYGSGKESANGTWLYVNDEFDVFNGMIFKYNQTMIQVGDI